MMSLPGAVSRPPVGVPIHETALTDAVTRLAYSMLPPGRGHGLQALVEVPTGVGRPDVLLVAFSVSRLRAWLRRAPPLKSYSEARVLAASILAPSRPVWESVGLTKAHGQRVMKLLRTRGWFDESGALLVGPMVKDSLLIEAKMSHWQSGLAQLVAVSRYANSSALLLPADKTRLVNRATLKRNGLGLIAHDPDGVRWVRRPRSRPLHLGANLWLSELVAREHDSSRSR